MEAPSGIVLFGAQASTWLDRICGAFGDIVAPGMSITGTDALPEGTTPTWVIQFRTRADLSTGIGSY